MKVRELIQDLLLVDQDLDIVLVSGGPTGSVEFMDSQRGWSLEFIEDGELWEYFDEHGEREYNVLAFYPV